MNATLVKSILTEELTGPLAEALKLQGSDAMATGKALVKDIVAKTAKRAAQYAKDTANGVLSPDDLQELLKAEARLLKVQQFEAAGLAKVRISKVQAAVLQAFGKALERLSGVALASLA